MTLTIGSYSFSSRLLLGTGKYPSNEVMLEALKISGTELVTVAVRRVDLSAKGNTFELLGDHYALLPNTAGCYTADEAIRTARLAREAGLLDLIKLEVIGDKKTLFPDNEELLKATKILVAEGFTVMPYTNDDIVMAKKLEDAGAACVMPLGAPIGTGLGIQNIYNILLIKEALSVPVIVDAGVGTASDAAVAMELGADGVLLNTAVAQAKDPVKMAEAMGKAVDAGRLAFEAGRMAKRLYATASSPLEGSFL